MQILPSISSSLLSTVSSSAAASSSMTSSSPSASSSSSSTFSTSSSSVAKSRTGQHRPSIPHRPVHTTLPQLTTISQHVRAVSTTDGLRSLWRGVASVIMGAGPAHAAHFGMYEFVREISGGRGEGWWGVGGTGEPNLPGTQLSCSITSQL